MAIWLKVGVLVVVLALAVGVYEAWKDSRQQQAALQAELKTTQQALADATARETSRNTALSALLAQLKKTKDAVQTPDQAVAALPSVLPLPEPITLNGQGAGSLRGTPGQAAAPSDPRDPAAASKANSGPSDAGSSGGKNPVNADFPAADLKPLYDFAVDCKSCQAQLAAAQADLKDERTKGKALSRERDDALRAAKGGSVFRRVVRAAKWFAIGTADGAIAAKAVR